MTKPSFGAVGRLLRLWGRILAGSMVGVAPFTRASSGSTSPTSTPGPRCCAWARTCWACRRGQVFARGIVAGSLIAIPVWRLPSAEHSKGVRIAVIAGMIGFA